MNIKYKKQLQSIFNFVFKTSILCICFAFFMFLVGITNDNFKENEIDYLSFLIILGLLFLIMLFSKFLKNKIR